MNRMNVFIIVARLIQIALGLAVMCWAIVLQEKGWPYSNDLRFSSIFTGAGIALFGSFGLFVTRRKPHEDPHLYLLVLYIDIWAVVMCVGAGTALKVSLNLYEPWDYSPSGTIAACGCAYAAIVFIVPLILRTLRLWWKRMLYTVPPDTEKPVSPVYYNPEPYNNPRQYYENIVKNTTPRSNSIAETTAHWSTVSGSPHTEHPAPAYSNRVEVGSKV